MKVNTKVQLIQMHVLLIFCSCLILFKIRENNTMRLDDRKHFLLCRIEENLLSSAVAQESYLAGSRIIFSLLIFKGDNKVYCY